MSANMASKAETLRSVSRNAEINPPVSGAYWFGELAPNLWAALIGAAANWTKKPCRSFQ
jgi:hypothetical protein